MTTLHMLERPFNCEDLSRAIRLAAKLHEDSFVEVVGGIARRRHQKDGNYTISIETASNKAVAELDLPAALARIVYLTLDGWWDDTLDWANEVHLTIHGPSDPPEDRLADWQPDHIRFAPKD